MPNFSLHPSHWDPTMRMLGSAVVVVVNTAATDSSMFVSVEPTATMIVLV